MGGPVAALPFEPVGATVTPAVDAVRTPFRAAIDPVGTALGAAIGAVSAAFAALLYALRTLARDGLSIRLGCAARATVAAGLASFAPAFGAAFGASVLTRLLGGRAGFDRCRRSRLGRCRCRDCGKRER